MREKLHRLINFNRVYTDRQKDEPDELIVLV